MKEALNWLMKSRFKYVLLLALILLSGAVGEFFFNLQVIVHPKQKGIQELELSKLKVNGFDYRDGVLTANKENPSIEIPVMGEYLDKLKYQYSYDFDKFLEADIRIQGDGAYGNQVTSRHKDSNNVTNHESVVNVRKNTDKIKISFQKVNENLKITAVQLDNSGNFVPVRYLFVCVVTMLVFLLFFARKLLVRRVDLMFLMISMSMGIVMIMAMPMHKVGFDEEVHFANVYTLFPSLMGKEEIPATSAIKDLSINSSPNWPLVQAQSSEERSQEIQFLNEHAKYTEDTAGGENIPVVPFNIKSVGYLTQAAFMEAGKALGLGFGTIYQWGRLGNLLLYCVVVFLAIRHVKIGKRIMAVAALMPTPMFQATVYSYDPTVMAFSLLGFAYLINEILTPHEKLSYKNFAVFVISFIIASCPKAVYIPMLLLGFLIPKEKFRNPRERLVLMGGIVVIFLGMMATFVLPAAGSDVAGDERGGNTGVSQQLKLIFSNPLAYARILIKSILDTFPSYTIGENAVSFIGHLGEFAYGTLASAVLMFTALTDRRYSPVKPISARQKLVIGAVLFSVICLIWTALYLSFTPIGAGRINGVQGRYYLPFLVPLLLLINSTKIVCKLNARVYNMICMGASTLILTVLVGQELISKCF